MKLSELLEKHLDQKAEDLRVAQEGAAELLARLGPDFEFDEDDAYGLGLMSFEEAPTSELVEMYDLRWDLTLVGLGVRLELGA